MLLTDKQKKAITLLRQGYELRIDISNRTFKPISRLTHDKKEPTTMKTITSLRAKHLIRDSDRYNPPYHYYILTDFGKTIQI